MSYAAIATVVVGAVASGVGSSRAAKAAKKASKPLRGIQIRTGEQRLRIASRLEELATKLLNDQPVSAAERSTIELARTAASQQIEKQRQITQENVLGAQAATGFLKSGRTARQLRRLNVEASEAQSRVALQQQQALVGATERKRLQAIQALGTALGAPGTQFQQFQQGLQPASILGTGLTQVGGALLARNIGQSGTADPALEQQQNTAAIQAAQNIAATSAGAAV